MSVVADKKLIVPPKKPKGDDGYHVFSIRIRQETVVELDKLAQRSGRSRNELIGLFLDYAIDNCEIGEKSDK